MQISDLHNRLPSRLRNLSLPDWRSPVWLRGAEAVLAVTLAWQLGGLVWEFGVRDPAPLVSGSPQTGGAASRGAPGGSTGGLGGGLDAARGLFGTPEAQSTGGEGSGVAPGESVAETDLNLTLKGILGSAGSRWAVIRTGEGEEKAYRQGDEVPGGATIVAVEARRVLLRRNGVTEALRMPEAEAASVASGRGRRGRGGGGGSGAIRQVDEHHRVADRDYVNRQLQDLPNLLRQAKAVPHKVNGNHRGFKIVNIQPGSVYEELGLKEGDVIRSVNGRDIRSPDQAMQAYKELRSDDSFRVRVHRDGQETTLQYTVK